MSRDLTPKIQYAHIMVRDGYYNRLYGSTVNVLCLGLERGGVELAGGHVVRLFLAAAVKIL